MTSTPSAPPPRPLTPMAEIDLPLVARNSTRHPPQATPSPVILAPEVTLPLHQLDSCNTETMPFLPTVIQKCVVPMPSVAIPRMAPLPRLTAAPMPSLMRVP